MKPKSLSASSIACYEACPSRWKHEWLLRVPQCSGDAAALGTVCHATLHCWVDGGFYDMEMDRDTALGHLRRIYDEEFAKLSADPRRQEEGFEMCRGWYDRQNWTGRTVLSTEEKKSFSVPTSQGPLKVSYIMDRMDRLDDGTIVVVDLKTNAWPVEADELPHKIQALIYALAAQIEYPQASAIEVVFDLLRFGPVSHTFTKDDNAKTWRYLKSVAERILADSTAEERLNDTCRFCVRRMNCDTLTEHAAGGGALGINDLADAVDRRAALHGANNALKASVQELDAFILESMEQEGRLSFETDSTVVKLSSRAFRTVDAPALTRQTDLLAGKLGRFAKLGIKEIDALLDEGNPVLTAEEKDQLRPLVRTGSGKASVRTMPAKG